MHNLPQFVVDCRIASSPSGASDIWFALRERPHRGAKHENEGYGGPAEEMTRCRLRGADDL